MENQREDHSNPKRPPQGNRPKCATGYKITESQEKINHLMYKEDITLFAKEEETLIQIVKYTVMI